MAADILLFDATHVPVGDDQTQHLELTAALARACSAHALPTADGDVLFRVPLGVQPDATARVMSLVDPVSQCCFGVRLLGAGRWLELARLCDWWSLVTIGEGFEDW